MKIVVFALICAGFLCGCGRRAATRAECESIFRRIVQLELQDEGYRDAALLSAVQSKLERDFATDLNQCVGLPLAPTALACVAAAKSTEDITHHCLR